MSIRNKLILFFIVQHLFFLLIAVVMFEFILRPHNLETEKISAKEKISQVRNVFDSEMRHLSLISTDWAIWDDTYAFVQDRNKEYIESNFPEGLLDDMKLNRVEIFDLSGKSVYSRDNAGLDMRPLMQDSQRLKKEFILSDVKTQGEKKSGIMAFGDKIALVSISAILQGDRKGPPVGVVLMIRIIGEEMITNINNSTHADVALLETEDFPLYKEYQDQGFFTEIVDADKLLAFGYLRGLDDKVSIVIQASLRREFAIQSEELILFLFIFAGILGFVSLIASLFLMQRGISKPLSALVRHISKIRNNENYTKCELDRREDEIGLMAKEFNQLLEKLNRTNETLLKVARIDALTGLPNRLDMEEKFQRIKNISIREGMEFTILMLDIDYFKNYNDTYGHVKGDEVLTLVGQEMRKSSMRPGDYFARYGGEEFIALLENTGTKGSKVVAERILKNIEKLRIEHKSSLLSKKIISLSIGCVSVTAKKGDIQESLINMADEALYRAKAKGRDQYHLYDEKEK